MDRRARPEAGECYANAHARSSNEEVPCMARNRTLRTGSASCKKAQPAKILNAMVLRRSGGRFGDNAQLPSHGPTPRRPNLRTKRGGLVSRHGREGSGRQVGISSTHRLPERRARSRGHAGSMPGRSPPSPRHESACADRALPPQRPPRGAESPSPCLQGAVGRKGVANRIDTGTPELTLSPA